MKFLKAIRSHLKGKKSAIIAVIGTLVGISTGISAETTAEMSIAITEIIASIAFLLGRINVLAKMFRDSNIGKLD